MKDAIADLRHRMRADFRLGIYLVFGALALLILLPLSFLRLHQGLHAQAVIDFAIVAFILGATLYAWRGGNLDRLAIVVAVGVTIGGCVATHIGDAGLFWLYPIVMAAAFIVRTPLAGVLCAAVIVFLLIDGDALARSGQPTAVIASMAFNGVFAMVFARRAGQRRAQLEQMAKIDPLTGAENRRALEPELEIAIAGFRRDGRPVSLALIDLDHFKKINDRHGHEVGDAVLQDFVRVVQASVRRTDRLFRYGGEEFVLLMPATDELGLELAMSHLRAQIRAGLSARGEPVTVSIGGAILRVGEDRDAWFTRADEALYRAKDSGRNRLEIDGV